MLECLCLPSMLNYEPLVVVGFFGVGFVEPSWEAKNVPNSDPEVSQTGTILRLAEDFRGFEAEIVITIARIGLKDPSGMRCDLFRIRSIRSPFRDLCVAFHSIGTS